MPKEQRISIEDLWKYNQENNEEENASSSSFSVEDNENSQENFIDDIFSQPSQKTHSNKPSSITAKEEPRPAEPEIKAEHSFQNHQPQNVTELNFSDFLAAKSKIQKNSSASEALEKLTAAGTPKAKEEIKNTTTSIYGTEPSGNTARPQTKASADRNFNSAKKKQKEIVSAQLDSYSSPMTSEYKAPRGATEVHTEKKDYYILEHSSKYVDKDDTDYDLYYEDILPIDIKQVEKETRSKGNIRTVIIWLLVVILIIVIIVILGGSYLSFVFGGEY